MRERGNILLTLLAVAVALFSAWKWSHERARRTELEAELLALQRARVDARTHAVPQPPIPPAEPLPTPSPTPMATAAVAPPGVGAGPVPSASPRADTPQAAEGGGSVEALVRARVHALTRFVTLDPAQTERVAEKYRRELAGETGTEKLDEIIGADNAAFYRQQVKQAFERAIDESQEKEVLYLSRRLAFSPDQENAVRSAFKAVEQQVEAEVAGRTYATRLERMVAEQRIRERLLVQALEGLLSPEQMQAYVRDAAESSAADFTSLHGP